MLIDISPALSARSPIWPGDTKFSAVRTWSIAGGGAVNVSAITLSTHAGAHADAPRHYDERGASIDEVALDPYIGPCVVAHVVAPGAFVGVETALAALDRVLAGRAMPERVLFRTYRRSPAGWDSAFSAIAAETIAMLADRGVRLIGVDTPSLDPEQSKTMDAHRAILKADMRVLEGLVLDSVAEGIYELIALPLKLAGLDAAPVRAALRTLP